MKSEKETKAKLLASAKKEFLEKGYMNASLRNICKNAGVTTGALYFFFEDKEDLFASLVEEPLNRLYEVVEEHFAGEGGRKAEVAIKEESDLIDDVLASKQIIHYMYLYYDEFQLVVNHSQGSRFEESVDRLVEILENQLRLMSDEMSKVKGCAKVDEYIIHWFSHMQVDMFLYMMKHEKSEEIAQKQIEKMIKVLISGWNTMFQ